MSLIIDAYLFAAHAHEGQKRKYNNAPYITHPRRVGQYLFSLGYNDVIVAAGFLHDILEDTTIDYDILYMFFPGRIFELVRELTNTSKQTGLPRAERKRLDIERIKDISRDGKIIKCADRYDNLKEMPLSEPFTRLYLRESINLLEVLEVCSDTVPYRDLTRQIEKMRRLYDVQE